MRVVNGLRQVLPVLPGAALVWLLGCSVNALESDEVEATQNSCQLESDCAEGASCVQGRCAAAKGELDTLLVTVTPPAGSEFGGTRFVLSRSGLSEFSGALEIEMDEPAVLQGYALRGDEIVRCPMRATFTPVQALLGLPAKEYVAQTDFNGDFDISLPPGAYDIYLTVPDEAPGEGCDLVPQLYRAVDVSADNSDLPLPLSDPLPLEVGIATGAPEQFTGWTAVLLEPESGRPISTPVVMDGSARDDEGFRFTLQHSDVVGDADGEELLRFSPPADVVAPAFIWKREGLELFSPGVVEIDLRALTTTVVQYEGFVDSPTFEKVAEANLVFASVELDGVPDGTQAAYQVTTQTDAAGKYSVPLLAGAYRVRVEPAFGSEYGAIEDTVVVSTQISEGGGKSIVLKELAVIAGNVVFGGGAAEPVVGAEVTATASPVGLQFDAYRAALGEVPFKPQATSTLTQEDGTFKVDADPGKFDLVVRPPLTTGLPWLIRQNVSVPNEGLGRLSLSAPVVYSGQVRIGNEPISGAQVRVYAYVGEAGYLPSDEGAFSVVAVGEAFADETGGISLFLPATLN